MPATIPALTDPPTAPSRSSPTTFAAQADAWVAWLEAWAPDFETAALASETNAGESYANAVNAAAAASGVSATNWVSGNNYSVGNVRTSPLASSGNGLPYLCIQTATGRTTLPEADPAYWRLAAVFTPGLQVVSGTSATAVASNHYVLTNASATTITLPSSPVAGDTVWISCANDRVDNVINRGGSDIMNVAENMTMNVRNGTVRLRYINSSIGWALV